METADYRKFFTSLNDSWGGIEPGILELVIALNEAGFETIGSCEGHADHGDPCPYVAIRLYSAKTPIGQKLETRAHTLAAIENIISAFKRVNRDRDSALGLRRLPIRSIAVLVSDEVAFERNVQLHKASIKNGAQSPSLSEEEQTRREKELPKLREEMYSLAKFISEHMPRQKRR